MRGKGFTLIELLVVITIISILAGILIPSVTEALFTAKVSACQQHLRILNRVFLIYMNNFGGYFRLLPHQTGKDFWRKLLYIGVIEEPKVLHCPVNPIMTEDVDYRGPAKDINSLKYYGPKDPIGGDWVDLDENRTAHGDPEKRGVNALLRNGHVIKIHAIDEKEWEKYLKKTMDD